MIFICIKAFKICIPNNAVAIVLGLKWKKHTKWTAQLLKTLMASYKQECNKFVTVVVVYFYTKINWQGEHKCTKIYWQGEHINNCFSDFDLTNNFKSICFEFQRIWEWCGCPRNAGGRRWCRLLWEWIKWFNWIWAIAADNLL